MWLLVPLRRWAVPTPVDTCEPRPSAPNGLLAQYTRQARCGTELAAVLDLEAALVSFIRGCGDGAGERVGNAASGGEGVGHGKLAGGLRREDGGDDIGGFRADRHRRLCRHAARVVAANVEREVDGVELHRNAAE